MPFDVEKNSVWDMLPTERLPRPVLLGIVCFAVLIALLAASGIVSSARGEFVISASASSSSAAIEKTEPDAESAEEDAKQADAVPDEASTQCYVYVVGSVKKPGVYELASDARVEDAVTAAGGFTKDADRAAVNLARPIVDGEQITIPDEGEQLPAKADVPSSAGIATSGSEAASGGKVNINTATAAELVGLPGIGDVTAEKIIASRESEGPFTSIEDLKRVSGIGEKKYAAVADLIAV